jgi:hypothetical protein
VARVEADAGAWSPGKGFSTTSVPSTSLTAVITMPTGFFSVGTALPVTPTPMVEPQR